MCRLHISIIGKMRSSYALEGEIIISVGDRTIKGTAGTMVFLSRDVRHSFTIESEQRRLLILLTPAGLEGWFKEFSVPAPAMILMPSQSMMEFPSFSRINKWEVSHAIQE